MQNIFIKYRLQLVKDKSEVYKVDNTITSPESLRDVAEFVCEISKETEEVLILLCLDCKNKIIGIFEVSRGSINESICNNREILKRAILCNSAGIAIVHNHPSGDPTPSPSDLQATLRLESACKLVGIDFIDHVIVGERGIFSFKKAESNRRRGQD